MIATLRGTVVAKEQDKVVLEVGGIGYEIFVTATTPALLPLGQECRLHLAESFAIYGGGQTLYGFLTPAEKALFLVFKDHVPSTGAKKALEYLEKASKSLPDFRRAILEKDSRILCGVFGFTRKSAERLIAALKDRLEAVPVPGAERLVRAAQAHVSSAALSQALSALSALGYRPSEARAALQAVTEENSGTSLGVEEILRLALKRL